MTNEEDAAAAEFGIKRGIADYQAGRPRPPMPEFEDRSPAAWRWYGYGIGMFRAIQAKRKVADDRRRAMEILGAGVPPNEYDPDDIDDECNPAARPEREKDGK